MNNPKVKISDISILSDNHYFLRKIDFEYLENDGQWRKQSRETYDRGNGATILLYNKEARSVILTKQFRMATYVNGNDSGMLIESCAGLLDKDDPTSAILRETEEETGFRVTEVQKIFEAYMSPGSVTEILYFFVGAYTRDMKVSDGGGVKGEHENIDVLELPFDKAIDMMATGEIKDGKTIMLLQYALLNKLLG